MSDSKVELKVEGLEEVLRGLDPKLATDVVRSTINTVAFQARIALQDHMKSVFDRPTPFTLSSIFVQKASNDNLKVVISIKDQATKGTPPEKYLKPEVFGGKRNTKHSERLLADAGILEQNEFLLPWKVPLNQYGNVSPGILQRVLSGLQAQRDPLQDSPAAGQGFKGTRKGRKIPRRYFAVRRKGIAMIFEKQLNSSGDGHVTPLFVSRRMVSYKPRLRFFEVIKKVMSENTQRIFNRELEYNIGKWFSKRK